MRLSTVEYSTFVLLHIGDLVCLLIRIEPVSSLVCFL